MALIASSTFTCGTISPPILLKRDSRSVMKMNPSSSMRAMSPVTYQPSRMTSAVFSGAFEVARHHVRPFDEQQAFLVRAEILAGLLVDDLRGHARNGMADRAGLVADLHVVAVLRRSGRLTATTGAISVQP